MKLDGVERNVYWEETKNTKKNQVFDRYSENRKNKPSFLSDSSPRLRVLFIFFFLLPERFCSVPSVHMVGSFPKCISPPIRSAC